jgi:Staphylococcal nuclease homologue
MVFGKEVILQTHGLDKYGRTLADVLLPDGTNVNHTLVKDGWCWWYRRYASGNTVLEGLEKDAREEKKGLWTDPQPVPPWEWRKRSRHCSPMAEFSGFVAEFPQVRAEPHSATPGSLPGGRSLGILNDNPDSQRKADQQDKIGKLKRSPIGEHTGHIEVKGHDHQW